MASEQPTDLRILMRAIVAEADQWLSSPPPLPETLLGSLTDFVFAYAKWRDQVLPLEHIGLDLKGRNDIRRYFIAHLESLTSAINHLGYKNQDTELTTDALAQMPSIPMGPWDELYDFLLGVFGLTHDSARISAVNTGQIGIYLDATVDARTAAEVIETLSLLYGGELLMTSVTPQPPRKRDDEEQEIYRRAGGRR